MIASRDCHGSFYTMGATIDDEYRIDRIVASRNSNIGENDPFARLVIRCYRNAYARGVICLYVYRFRPILRRFARRHCSVRLGTKFTVSEP